MTDQFQALREALAQVTGTPPAPVSSPLKETLQKVAPPQPAPNWRA